MTVAASIFCRATLLTGVMLYHITFKWYLQSHRHNSSAKPSQDILGKKLCIHTGGERQAFLEESLESKLDVCVCKENVVQVGEAPCSG